MSVSVFGGKKLKSWWEIYTHPDLSGPYRWQSIFVEVIELRFLLPLLALSFIVLIPIVAVKWGAEGFSVLCVLVSLAALSLSGINIIFSCCNLYYAGRK